ncbi:MAG: hypothetical protein ABIJ53_05490 [Verrucomicrobiota bacterium]
MKAKLILASVRHSKILTAPGVAAKSGLAVILRPLRIVNVTVDFPVMRTLARRGIA